MILFGLWLVGCARGPDWLAAGGSWPAPEGCPPSPPVRVEGALAVRLVVEQGVSEERVARLGRIAAAWWGAQGLTLTPDGFLRVAEGPALGGDAVALEAELAGLSPAEAEARVLEVSLAPLRAWMGTHAVPARPRVDVVFVDALVPPQAPMARVASGIGGFTIAPGLLDDDAFGARIAAALGLGADFTPTVLLSEEVLAGLPEEEAAWVLPHELGHAMGLPHDREPGNLMAPGFYRCPPRLRAGQVARLVGPRR